MNEALHHVLPYIVNFSILVVGVVFFTRKPFQRFVYQRHERIKDSAESAARDRSAVEARVKKVEAAVAAFSQDAERIRTQERLGATQDVNEIAEKARQELASIQSGGQRIIENESRERQLQVRGAYVDLILRETEEKLKKGLKREDHSGLVKSAGGKIEANA